MRIALVGLGDVAKHHAKALIDLEAIRVLGWTAMCARDANRIEAFRIANEVDARIPAFTSLDALIAARVCDAVILATPDALHESQAIACATAGLHVLVEKPLALTRESGARILQAAHDAKVRIAVGYHLRHHVAHRMMRAKRDELVGALRNISVQWAWPDPATDGWRARGESARFWSLAALGTHAIDLAFYFSDSRVTDVSAVREPPQGIDRAAEVSMRFENGVLAHVSCAVTHRTTSRVILAGDRGELEALNTLGARGDGQLFRRKPRDTAQRIDFMAGNPYFDQLTAFVKGDIESNANLANLEVLDRIGEDS